MDKSPGEALRRLICMVVALAAAPALGVARAGETAKAATAEQIGSWVLSCPAAPSGTERCQLRARKRFLDKAGVTGDLEVLADGGALVPVITLRGVPTELLTAVAMAGTTEASMQFAGGSRESLDCGATSLGYVCAARDKAARRLAASLGGARSVIVRVAVSIPGVQPLPAEERTLDLAETTEALGRLRAAGPSALPGRVRETAAPSPAGMMAVADRMLKSAGYPNGLADLQKLLARHRVN